MTQNGGRRSRYYRGDKSTGLSVSGEKSVGRTRTGRRLPSEYVDDLGSSNDDNRQTVKSNRHSPMPVSVIIMIAVCTVMFMMMVWSFVRINEYTVDIENLQDRLDSLKSSRSQLSIMLEQKNNLQEIQEYAVNVLGMVKIDQLAKKYITVDKDDMIVVLDENRKIAAPETTAAPEETAETGETGEASAENNEPEITAAQETFETEPPVNIAETEAGQ